MTTRPSAIGMRALFHDLGNTPAAAAAATSSRPSACPRHGGWGGLEDMIRADIVSRPDRWAIYEATACSMASRTIWAVA